MTNKRIEEKDWGFFEREGYLRLGKLLEDAELHALREEIDAVMLGRAAVNYDRMMMQLDGYTGDAKDAGEKTKGLKKATLDYRKITELEFDPVFLRYMQRPVFRECCDRIYGEGTPVSAYRAMFFNKPASGGSVLGWHQDWFKDLDRDPSLTVWTALDPATKENGCVRIISGSHRERLQNTERPSPFLSETQVKALCPEDKTVHLEMGPGEVVLLHNYLLHGSDLNRSGKSRRAFSVCYMDASTRRKNQGGPFSILFGKGALTPESLKTAV